MTWVAVAVGGAAVIGAGASIDASNKSAKSTAKGLSQSKDLAGTSRAAAIDLYNRGRNSSQLGLGAAMDFYKKAVPSRYSPVLLGSSAAQNVVGQGAAQANNAILGNPVDMSFAQAQQINPDLSYIQAAQIPEYAGDYVDPSVVATQPIGSSQVKSGGSASTLGKIEGLGKKLASKDPVAKAIKKLF